MGDCWDRYLVRVQEMRESIKILEQTLAGVPGGDFKVRVPLNLKPPAGEAYVAVESPRGELGFYIVSDGSEKPYRIKVRPPCFAIYQAYPQLIKGGLIADAVAILGALNVVAGELDR